MKSKVVSPTPSGDLEVYRGKRLLTIRETCAMLGIGRTHLYRHLGTDIPVVRMGKSVRVHIDDVTKFMADRRDVSDDQG